MYFALIIIAYLLYDKELFEITSSSKFSALHDIAVHSLKQKFLWHIAHARSSRIVHMCLLSLPLIKSVYIFSDN